MSKKFIIWIAIISLILLMSYFLTRGYKYYFPKSTGGIMTAPIYEDVSQGNAVNSLILFLPYERQDFSIVSYNYAKGKFLVRPNDSAVNIEASFDEWYKNSEYTSIPRHMFEIDKQLP